MFNLKFIIIVSFLLVLTSCSQTRDNLDKRPGIHLITGGLNPDSNYRYIGENFNNKEVSGLLKSLDWFNGFHQIIIVKEDYTSMEVGGSMHADHGLSGVYRDYRNENRKIHLVTNYPPDNIDQMKQILTLFMSGDESWKQIYEFK